LRSLFEYPRLQDFAAQVQGLRHDANVCKRPALSCSSLVAARGMASLVCEYASAPDDRDVSGTPTHTRLSDARRGLLDLVDSDDGLASLAAPARRLVDAVVDNNGDDRALTRAAWATACDSLWDELCAPRDGAPPD
jgi:hypothetical protein